jgi:hypothetical protein
MFAVVKKQKMYVSILYWNPIGDLGGGGFWEKVETLETNPKDKSEHFSALLYAV